MNESHLLHYTKLKEYVFACEALTHDPGVPVEERLEQSHGRVSESDVLDFVHLLILVEVVFV